MNGASRASRDPRKESYEFKGFFVDDSPLRHSRNHQIAAQDKIK